MKADTVTNGKMYKFTDVRAKVDTVTNNKTENVTDENPKWKPVTSKKKYKFTEVPIEINFDKIKILEN